MSKTSRLPAHSEQDLVAAIRAGDDRAFEELYSQYRERIFGFILSKVHDHGRAEDIAQEVFMSALRRMRSSDQAIAFKPWIYEIAKNACIDEFRRGSRGREVPLEADGEFVVDRQKSAVSSAPTPAAAVESKQRLDDLRGAFGGLSTTHHQLLVMREFEGMSYDEIGQRLDMTRQMVESGLFRARRKLNDEYQELASGQRCEQIQTAIESGRLRAVSSLGIRDRRRCARHLSHCQPCRHAALMAGVDEALLRPRSIAAKIAALLPFPLWRLPWRSRGAKAASTTGSHHVAGAGSAGLVPSAGAAFSFGQAAATVAVIIAGAGGGLAVHGLTGGHSHHVAASPSAHRVSSGAGGATAPASASAAKTARAGGSVAQGPSAINFVGSRTASTPRQGTRRQSGSAPGAPGTGKAGGGTSAPGSGPAQGTAASRPSPAGAATTAVKGVTKTVTGLGQTVTNAGKALGSAATGAANGLNSTVHKVTAGVKQTVQGVDNTLGKVTSGAGNAVSTATNGAVNPTQTVSTVNKVVNTVGNGVADTGTKLVNGAANGATGAVGKVGSGLTGGAPGPNAVLGGGSGSSSSAAGAGASASSSTPAASSSTPASSTPAASSSSAGQSLTSGLTGPGGLLGH